MCRNLEMKEYKEIDARQQIQKVKRTIKSFKQIKINKSFLKNFLKEKQKNKYIKTQEQTLKIQNQIFQCQICFRDQLKPIILICGDTFCESCFLDFTKIASKCLICNQNLKFTEYYQSQCLNEIIEKYTQYDSLINDQIANYLIMTCRLEEYQTLKKQTQLDKLEINLKIDFLNNEFKWKQANIEKIIYKNKKPKFINVAINEQEQIYKELISIKSNRIAKFGTFTDAQKNQVQKESYYNYMNQRYISNQNYTQNHQIKTFLQILVRNYQLQEFLLPQNSEHNV